MRFLAFVSCFVQLVETALYVLLFIEFVTFSQHVGPHSGSSFTLRAAPAHLPSQETRWDLLICLPPSNLQQIFIYPSAKFVVKFPVI